MKYPLVIFDFDGTLADSFPFFISVFNRLACQHRFNTIEPERIADFRGYSARQMMAHVRMPRWRLPFVAHSFSKMMNGASEVQAFDGTRETVEYLVRQGLRLTIVTANSRENVINVLGHETFRRFEQVESGVSIFGKASKISRILSKAGIAPDRAIYIGDQATDLEAARKAKVAFGAVSWGYATPESLLDFGPDVVFHCLDDLRSLAES